MRTTQKELESLVEQINKATASPLHPWTKQEGGKLVANVGSYHLDWGYGGVRLCRMANEHGATSSDFSLKFVPKRELADWMRAYLAGIRIGRLEPGM